MTQRIAGTLTCGRRLLLAPIPMARAMGYYSFAHLPVRRASPEMLSSLKG